LIVGPDAVSLASALVRHFDEPFGDSSASPTFLVSEFAARHVKVVLTGDGGDEMFAGYRELSQHPTQAQAGPNRIPHVLRRTLAALADSLPYAAYGKNCG
jgi:asparagine synthase (glutamine-hydrolysing)